MLLVSAAGAADAAGGLLANAVQRKMGPAQRLEPRDGLRPSPPAMGRAITLRAVVV